MRCLRLLRKDFEKKFVTFTQLSDFFPEWGLKIQDCKPRARVGAKLSSRKGFEFLARNYLRPQYAQSASRKGFEKITHYQHSSDSSFCGAKQRKFEHTSHGRKVVFPKGSWNTNCYCTLVDFKLKSRGMLLFLSSKTSAWALNRPWGGAAMLQFLNFKGICVLPPSSPKGFWKKICDVYATIGFLPRIGLKNSSL
jgi:hypothetical protein